MERQTVRKAETVAGVSPTGTDKLRLRPAIVMVRSSELDPKLPGLPENNSVTWSRKDGKCVIKKRNI